MTKVEYKNFSDVSLVGGLKRKLPLDKSSFTGLPSDEFTLQSVKLHADQEKNLVKSVDLIGFDKRAFDETKKAIDSMPSSIPDEVKQSILANLPTVKFKILVQDAENGQESYDFLESNDLLVNGKNRVISGISYKVYWEFVSTYADRLTLVVDNLEKCKVSKLGN